MEAGKLSVSEGAERLDTGHLLRAAIHDVYDIHNIYDIQDSGIAQALGEKGHLIESAWADPAHIDGSSTGTTSFRRVSALAGQALSLANTEADRLGSSEVGLRHILLALADQHSGPAVDLLQSVGMDLNQFHSALLPSAAPPLTRLAVETVVDGYVGGEPLPQPDFDALPDGVLEDLEGRLPRIPVGRIRRRGDYYALVSVEADHISRIGRQLGLADRERESLNQWWLGEIERCYPEIEERLSPTAGGRLRRPMPRIRPGLLFQIWFNILGPGARCWFGNRYVTLRRYTLRLHWRP